MTSTSHQHQWGSTFSNTFTGVAINFIPTFLHAIDELLQADELMPDVDVWYGGSSSIFT